MSIYLSLMIALFILVKFIHIVYDKNEETLTRSLAAIGIFAVVILSLFMVDTAGEFTKYLK